MRLSKEEFIKAINDLKVMMHQRDEIANACGISYDSIPFDWIISYYEFLKEMCDLKLNDSLFDYYIFNLDFGKYYEPGCIKGEDIHTHESYNIKLETPEDLYSQLI